MNSHVRTITVVSLLGTLALGAVALTGLWHPNAPAEAMKMYLPQITLLTVLVAGAMELSAEELPAVCPRASMPLWAWHPRVFLDVVNQDEAMCPYCSTRYRLRPDTHVHDHEFGARCLHQHRKRDLH